ncbi:malonate decarboxylase holo-[acyl-carrier-protein] synthase [Burkholderia thailandensis]|uniref:Malonate decarboxylase holo-[acyl-carrier-protein] synthase n=4 Tax=Burkholderia thailandensis TaxID=57975 RepID=A0AAW9D450_BURTH|nr:malonate decarboxylase holo-[acyl-carrier-protein] synthase [Burkholderia thailandensis]AHI64636.1 malonate decarboxylase holo-[acyl-carrier-protein] synthase [Burkholderia thailandensis H0587]AIP63586.1 phosphoribosyl-dephospho-CoA transferase [Burkholderia thailandensis]AOI52300.1 phosphoribosyl-dephospho-CoA transferase [Burkholderia thailandensis]AOJ51279.1 phosphoribosyl-dephospho-CoA transferase [Burkholderia thailandensis]AVR26719.1 malonate decarboxylase holo-[acyl-carrier-protein] 
MSSRAPAADAPLVRHALAHVRADAWPALLAAHEGIGAYPFVRDWAARGWPLIVRRRSPCDAGVPLGLPLPPSAGKRRVALAAAREQIEAVRAPPALGDVIGGAPPAWRPTLARLRALADAHCVDCRVFGSLAWQTLTGLRYLSDESDLDVLLMPSRPPLPSSSCFSSAMSIPHSSFSLPDSASVSSLTASVSAFARAEASASRPPPWSACSSRPSRRDAIASLLAALAEIDADAPMRIDGELLCTDGTGVNWRELHAGGREIAMKTATGVELAPPQTFLEAWR